MSDRNRGSWPKDRGKRGKNVPSHGSHDCDKHTVDGHTPQKIFQKVMSGNVMTYPYLWRILRKFGFQEKTINIIKTLYRDAPTSVIVNGVISNPFNVTRGVRQGDPMSCILFDLAIEPLTANIKTSDIRGINLPSLDEKAKVSLFADDTTVVLTEHDSLADLIEILNKWCEVSRAKFNAEKTEIIPIGSPEYREKLTRTRTINTAGELVPASIHIARDKGATRILGAWVGNETNREEPWKKIVETIKKDFKRLETRYPTLEETTHSTNDSRRKDTVPRQSSRNARYDTE